MPQPGHILGRERGGDEGEARGRGVQLSAGPRLQLVLRPQTEHLLPGQRPEHWTAARKGGEGEAATGQGEREAASLGERQVWGGDSGTPEAKVWVQYRSP